MPKITPNLDSVPQFTLKRIQIEVGGHEFQKGLNIYQSKKVKNIEANVRGYSAQVEGTNVYRVYVDRNSLDRGMCNCYLGQKDILCKHMIALAIAIVYEFNPAGAVEIIEIPLDQAVCSGKVSEITDEEVETFKNEIRQAVTYIKGYSGPSSKWFQYQDSLIKGSRLILLAVAKLPVCEKSALLCIGLLKRLDKKLLGPVDDSDGTVGDTMCQIVEVLNMFSDDNPQLRKFIKKKLPQGECFDWGTGFGISSK